MLIQLDYTPHTCINIHIYKQVLFNIDFWRENVAEPTNLPTHIFFIAAGTFLTVLSASSCVPYMVGPLLVASTLGDLVAAAIATILVTSKQTQSLYIQ